MMALLEPRMPPATTPFTSASWSRTQRPDAKRNCSKPGSWNQTMRILQDLVNSLQATGTSLPDRFPGIGSRSGHTVRREGVDPARKGKSVEVQASFWMAYRSTGESLISASTSARVWRDFGEDARALETLGSRNGAPIT
jgi:hypothetical protein